MNKNIERGRSIKLEAQTSKKMRNVFWRDRYLYLLFMPVLVYFIVFKYIPMIGNIIAFKDYKISLGILQSQWVGVQHFVRLFHNEEFLRIFWNTLSLSIYGIVFGFPIPIVLAILLNEVKMLNYKKIVQSILYIPYFVSWTILGGIIIAILSPSSGIINSMLIKLGVQPIFFMADSFWWRVVYVVSGIWKGAGWGTIIYLAAITGIDAELYEAARIDGANKFRQIIHITLPGLTMTIVVLLILNMGSVINLGFEQIYILQNDMVKNISEVFATYEYRLGIQKMQYSYTTALGLFKSVVSLILIVGTNLIANRLSDNEAGLW